MSEILDILRKTEPFCDLPTPTLDRMAQGAHRRRLERGETVSRTLTAWERNGIVSAGREYVTILKHGELITIAKDLVRTA